MKAKLHSNTNGEQPKPAVENNKIQTLLSPADFGRHLGVCSATVRRMEKRGLIRGLRFNKRLVRYPATELQRLQEEAA
jgi:hypothetical protein